MYTKEISKIEKLGIRPFVRAMTGGVSPNGYPQPKKAPKTVEPRIGTEQVLSNGDIATKEASKDENSEQQKVLSEAEKVAEGTSMKSDSHSM